jgi:hypothetical protein
MQYTANHSSHKRVLMDLFTKLCVGAMGKIILGTPTTFSSCTQCRVCIYNVLCWSAKPYKVIVVKHFSGAIGRILGKRK